MRDAAAAQKMSFTARWPPASAPTRTALLEDLAERQRRLPERDEQDSVRGREPAAVVAESVDVSLVGEGDVEAAQEAIDREQILVAIPRVSAILRDAT